MSPPQPAIRQLLDFAKQHGTQPLDADQERRLMTLDAQTGWDCDEARLEIPQVDFPHPAQHTPRTRLAYSRESVYEGSGVLGTDDWVNQDDSGRSPHRSITLEPTQAWWAVMEALAERFEGLGRSRSAGEIARDDLRTCGTLKEIVAYAEEHFGHRPSKRSLQNWTKSGALRYVRRGKLWDFSHSDLESLVRKS